MILGIGTDIVEIKRIRKVLQGPQADRFLKRILIDAEITIALERRKQHPARMEQFVAGRFAVKEAVSKAMGCGIGEKLSFRDIQILHDENGRPQCSLSEQSTQRLNLENGTTIHVSISHSDEYAIGYAVVEKGSSRG